MFLSAFFKIFSDFLILKFKGEFFAFLLFHSQYYFSFNLASSHYHCAIVATPHVNTYRQNCLGKPRAWFNLRLVLFVREVELIGQTVVAAEYESLNNRLTVFSWTLSFSPPRVFSYFPRAFLFTFSHPRSLASKRLCCSWVFFFFFFYRRSQRNKITREKVR